MGSEWSEIALADCLAFVVDNRGKSAPLEDQGIPLIATNCISNENTYPVYERVRYVSEDTFNNWFRSHPLPGDVILTNKGSKNGAVCLVPSPVEFCIAQDMVALRANKAVIDPLYLFAILRSKVVQDRIKNLNVDSVIPHFKKTDFDKLFLPYPSRKTQEFIGRFYFYFCEKIELNRQINTTLESMAQALFKSWFVDFDPVIDNALAAGNEIPDALAARAARREALRQQTNETSNKTTGATDADSSEQALTDTGLSDQRLPPEIQQLFPDRFVLTEEIGWVPEGWEVKPLSSIIELIGGGTPKTSIEEYWGGDIPWFSVVDAPNSSDVFVLNTEKSITQSGLDNSSAKLLRKGTTIISARGTVGKCAVVSRPMAMNQSCYGLVGANGNADFFTYYMVLRKVHELQQRSHGSVFSTITRDTFKGLNVADCSALLTQKFDEQIEYYMDRILCNLEQIQVLTNLRDSLLPKLLSGQLTIPDAEQQLAEVL